MISLFTPLLCEGGLKFLQSGDGGIWYGFKPFCVVFSSGDYPLMSLERMGIDLSEKIQTPFRKWQKVMGDL